MGKLKDIISKQDFQEFKRGFAKLKVDKMIRDRTWVTADGDELPVIEMETAHIENVISLLKRKKLEGILKMEDKMTQEARNDFVKQWIPIFNNELDNRRNDTFHEVTGGDMTALFPNLKQEK